MFPIGSRGTTMASTRTACAVGHQVTSTATATTSDEAAVTQSKGSAVFYIYIQKAPQREALCWDSTLDRPFGQLLLFTATLYPCG